MENEELPLLKFDKRKTVHLPKKPRPKNWWMANKQSLGNPAPERKNEHEIKWPSNKQRKPISPIGKRTKERLRENGSETEFFLRIWEERPHICEICWEPVHEPLAVCFSHRLSKWRYPALRYEPKNVTLVCSEGCHHENDRRNAWDDLRIINEIFAHGDD